MDPRRKKLYLILIATCVCLSALILWWSHRGGSDIAPIAAPATTVSGTGALPVKNTDGSFTPPALFPLNTSLDTSVLNGSSYKTLKPYTIPQITAGELGREDPFKSY